jgi:hypothetical protein
MKALNVMPVQASADVNVFVHELAMLLILPEDAARAVLLRQKNECYSGPATGAVPPLRPRLMRLLSFAQKTRLPALFKLLCS